MDWQEFQKAKSRLCPNELPPMLFQTGGFPGDNRTHAEGQKGTWWTNSQSVLFNGKLNDGRDFIWDGKQVRVMNSLQTGGHPALAGFDLVYCAGRIEEDFFFFHSGHYRPELDNALYFFAISSRTPVAISRALIGTIRFANSATCLCESMSVEGGAPATRLLQRRRMLERCRLRSAGDHPPGQSRLEEPCRSQEASLFRSAAGCLFRSAAPVANLAQRRQTSRSSARRRLRSS
jgi:hypothetical protein